MIAAVRMATVRDARAVLEIYSPYVLETSITFAEEVPSLSEIERRISACLTRFPYLVCEIDGQIAGYAYSSSYRTAGAYRYDTESSIYLAPQYRGFGIGSALYRALLELLRAQGFYTVYACIATPNQPSEQLHRALGFTVLAAHKATGYKLGEWRDVLWMEKVLLPRQGSPCEPLCPQDLDPDAVTAILKQAGQAIRLP